MLAYIALIVRMLSGQPMSAYEPQATYYLACDVYRATGDTRVIEVDIGEGNIGHLECADYTTGVR